MIEYLHSNLLLVLFLVVLFFGNIFQLFFRNQLIQIWDRITSQAPLIKKYWLFVITFILISFTSYWIIINYSPSDKVDRYLSILNTWETIIFAIFIGYFAFTQLVESRVDKLQEQAYSYLRSKSYKRSITFYEQLYSINPKDPNFLPNLLEVYLLNKQYDKFSQKLPRLSGILIEDRDKYVLFYLIALRYLLEQNLGTAKESIYESIAYSKDHVDSLESFSWDFSDLCNSDIYNRLTGEAKTLLDNFIKFLGRRLTEEEKNKFLAGNYTLSPDSGI